MCAVSESGRGTRIHVIHVAAAFAWRTFAAGSRGPYAPPVLARGNVTDMGREGDRLGERTG